jgi:hypothetical protein
MIMGVSDDIMHMRPMGITMNTSRAYMLMQATELY